MHKVYIALQEVQEFAIMLCRMALHLSVKVFALHLEGNNASEGYLCDQDDRLSLSFQTSMLHIESGRDWEGCFQNGIYFLT